MSSTTQHVSAVAPPAASAVTPDSLDRHQQLARIARWSTVAAIVVAALLSAGAVGLSLYAYSHSGRIYEGVTVAGVSVGGMTREEAEAAVAQQFDAYAAVPLALVVDGDIFSLTPAEAGASLDRDATVAAAFSYGRDGSLWERSGGWARALVRGVSLNPRIRIDATRFDAQLEQIAGAVDRSPIDAYVLMATGGEPELVPDATGVSLGIDEARRAVIDRIARMDPDPVNLVTASVPAAVSAARLTAGLPAAQTAVGAPLVLSSAEGSWTVPSEDLRQLVSVNTEGALMVDRMALAAYVAEAAADVDRQAVDTGIEVQDEGALVVVPGSYAAIVDQEATLEGAVEALLAGGHTAPVVIERLPPAITDAEAHAAIADAEELIGEGVDLAWDDDGTGRLERADLLRALVLEPEAGADQAFAVSLDPDLLAEVLFPIQEEIDIPVRDASFRLVDGNVTLVEKEKGGRATDVVASVDAILAALADDKGPAQLLVVDVDPTVRASDIKSIEVTELIGDAASYYGNSSEPRRQNVERAVDLETGWLVPPNGVFSYVEHIGDIDEESGFATGFGIVADEERGGVTTAPVIGGGICQVSTTIFQAAFWAGLQIEERWQHPYWLTGYGQPPRGMKGLDAMVNVENDWALDMKFRNTTDNWIAVVVIYDSENVTAQILGTDPGWDVTVADPIIANVVPKDEKVYYTDSPELPKGQELQVESALEGFDAEIRRTVVKDGEVIDEYVLRSSFAASRTTILRGTGDS